MIHRPFAAVVLAAVLSWAAPLAAEPGRVTIGFAQDNMRNDWRAAQVHAVRDALAGHDHVDFLYTDAGGSLAQNILDIEDLIDHGIDLLMLSPSNPVAMAPVVEAIHARGIPVVLLTRRLASEGYTTFVGPSDRQIAAQAAATLAEALDGQGRVVMLKGVPTATTAIDRSEGFITALEQHPGLTLVATEVANYLRADAIQAIERLLADGLAFDAIYAQSDSMAEGARLALRQAGIDPASVAIVGIDYITPAREAIRAGEQLASFTYPTSGTEAAALALRLLAGETVPREVEVPSVRVTAENVEQVEPIF